MTSRRAMDLNRHESCQRRGGGQTTHPLDVDKAKLACEEPGAAGVIDGSPSPEFAAMMADECRRLLELLSDAQLRAIAVAKMEGYNNDEIAGQLKCSLRTVERRLKLIRDRWKHELD